MSRLSQWAGAAPDRRTHRFRIRRSSFGYDEHLFGIDRILPGLHIAHAAEQTFYCSYQLARRKARYGFKLICLQAEINPFWAEGHGNVLERAAFVRKTADLFIARSERARSALLCEGVEPERIRVIGHGIDTKRFAPGPRSAELCQKFGIAPDSFVVLLVGRARLGERSSTAWPTPRDWCCRTPRSRR